MDQRKLLMEIRKYFALNGNASSIHQSLSNAAKVVLTWERVVLNTYIRREGRSTIRAKHPAQEIQKKTANQNKIN